MNTETHELALTPIGVIHTGFKRQEGTPIQSAFAEGAEGHVDLHPEWVDGLKDLDGFERIWLIYWLDRARSPRMTVTPYLDREEHGVFATRAPSRPNPIGMSCVRLTKILGNRIVFKDADMLDGTPLLDIKPYVNQFDHFEECRCGWYNPAKEASKRADDRFVNREERGEK